MAVNLVTDLQEVWDQHALFELGVLGFGSDQDRVSTQKSKVR
jgi:hypothetical protein